MKVVASNRRARFDYEILETIEAGIVLTGAEAKSCRLGHADLAGAYVSFVGRVPAIKHLKIMPYRFAANTPHEVERVRTLLLSKTQAEKLAAAADQKGISIIPLELKAGKFIKLTLGLGRGRKTIDKRHKIKEREVSMRLKRGEEV